jgi:hypothetical protein
MTEEYHPGEIRESRVWRSCEHHCVWKGHTHSWDSRDWQHQSLLLRVKLLIFTIQDTQISVCASCRITSHVGHFNIYDSKYTNIIICII